MPCALDKGTSFLCGQRGPDAAMPLAGHGKGGFLGRNSETAGLFDEQDPEKLFIELREIGHGSFGAVYYARNSRTNEVVAIKKMSYSGKQSSEKWQDIVKEVKFLKLCNHKNTISYKGCHLKDHTAWLVMEYCVGSASDILEVHKKPLREVEIAAICQDALQGLRYLHRNGRIHRDVKAGNVLLTEDGTVKLADFGSAALAAPANSFVGTPYWMAPEVILAMDEGQYDGKVDVWSLGITCVELAERKPPLFNMNAMSALYHIAQNDPPMLTTPDSWSACFVEFVQLCLRKQPANRPTAEDLLQHPFVSQPRPEGIILELIERTKQAVRALDNMNYRKMKKMIMGDPSGEVNEEGDSSIAETEDDDDKSEASVFIVPTSACHVNFDGVLEEGDGPTASEDSLAFSEDSLSSSSSFLHFRSAQSAELDKTKKASVSSTASVASSTDSLQGVEQDSEAATPGSSSFEVSSISLQQHHREDDDRFATIRPQNLIARQHQEHNRQGDEMRDQLEVYKKLRQNHQKEVRILEGRLQLEMNDHRRNLDREYDQQVHQFEKDLEKLRTRQKTEMEQKLKQMSADEKRLLKHIKDKHDNDMKMFLSDQKAAYKAAKNQFKKDQSNRSSYQGRKNSLHAAQENALREKMHEHDIVRNAELRKFRREQLLQRQNLEKVLLTEEMNMLESQNELSHSMLIRHHECTQDLEFRHLNAVHRLRRDQQQNQHQTEYTSQVDYNKRLEMELRKKHLFELKMQPKTLKAREMHIKKQYRNALKTQTLQYKALQKQILEKAPKERHKELTKQLREEKMRKMADLSVQYDQSISEMLQRQTLKLDESQVREQEVLRIKLQQEEQLLSAYQSKQTMQLRAQHEREETDLQDKVSVRRALLEEKMFQETTRLQDIRAQRQEELELKHARELEDFDTNSNSGAGPNTFSLKHRSTSSISNVSTSSTTSSRSTENNGTVVQQPSNDEARLHVSAGPMRV
ncbi:serine/threonine-protein kinase TAO3-like isoform X2 [Orbicella faveolata]|uniref:serine/threonine-protein kinase TAO3-like isoform X2 n=1 Tax=Orbicella faveolata TaxID=48498 RepID=UPI0009E3BC20|nr:serine/threonine-protein kinase TAO3-like isoform X2 [Orbicella faveolata]